jgi:type II secretory pathway pseudopilin PulG
MKLLPKLLAATSIFAATAAIAGPPVTGSSQKTENKAR